MPLSDATARAAVQAWAAPYQWAAADVDAVVALLVEVAAEVTPHVVGEATLPAADVQEYLLTRAVGRAEDWLARAAAPVRAAFRLDEVRLTPAGALAVGLVSATEDEINALPGIGDEVAAEIARVTATLPGITIPGLDWIDDVGPARVAALSAAAYVDRPVAGLLSPTLLAFCARPDVAAFLALLAATDLSFCYGDGTTFARRGVAGGTVLQRFTAFLRFVRDDAARVASPAAGVRADDVRRRLARRRALGTYVQAVSPATGTLLVEDAYVAAATALIDAATTTVDLMVFLCTLTASGPQGPGPLTMVEALEAAAVRGVTVRVLLDQDVNGEPYGSANINRAAVRRFQAGAVDIRLDDPDVLLHSKVLVVDGASAVVGSHNWTGSAFTKTHELSVAIHDATVAAAYAARFQTIWDSRPPLP